MNSNGQATSKMVSLVIGVIVILVMVVIFMSLNDTFGKSNKKTLCTATVGTAEMPYNLIPEANCPCDSKDLPRYYTVKKDKVEKFHNLFPDIDRLADNELPVLEKYFEAKVQDENAKPEDYLQFNDGNVNVAVASTISSFRSANSVCPDAGNKWKKCNIDVFKEYWFEEGVYGKPKCKTPPDECKEMFLAKCNLDSEKDEKKS